MALSYEKGVDLAFDTGALRSAAKEYRGLSSTLTGLKDRLTALIDQLSATDWTTNAGKAFKNMVEQDWSTNVGRYCDLLDTLADLLDGSAAEYESLVADHVVRLRLG